MNELANHGEAEHANISFIPPFDEVVSHHGDAVTAYSCVAPVRTMRGRTAAFVLCLMAPFLGLLCPAALAQAGHWDWVSGSGANAKTVYGTGGVYGTQGVAAPTNVPPIRARAITWIDASGKFWMFGGYTAVNQEYNDLWKYDPSTGYWTWISGPSAGRVPANYGTLGVPAATNIPGGRYGSVSWIDSSGKLWLFGGLGYDSNNTVTDDINDLWVFDPSTGNWTWMGGSTTVRPPDNGMYGTLDTPSANNIPGGRDRAASWLDSNGDLWLYGGNGFAATGTASGELSDLWKLDAKTLQWTWMGGSSAVNQFGSFGTQGTAAAGNHPGGNIGPYTWVDGSGNFWLFGGAGYAKSGSANYLNDLWEYSPSTGLWTWVRGDAATARVGVYGAQGIAAAANQPGGRYSGATWVDGGGNLWLFGGDGEAAASGVKALNDLWEFNPSTGYWIWMGGSSAGNNAAVFSTQGQATSANDPGGRFGEAGWLDSSGNFWFFGGYFNSTTVSNNDFWEYQFPAADLPAFNPVEGNYTVDQSVSISDTTPGAIIYYTTDGTTPTASSTVYTGSLITVNTPQTIQAVATASGYSLSPVASAAYTFTRPTATAPVINPPTGAYAATQTVTITDSTPSHPGATIYYTTDGSTPTVHSPAYGGPFTVTPPAVVQGIAVAYEYSNSAVASAIYTKPTVATPVFNPPAGAYDSTQFVTMTDATPGATIYYTIDGSTPTTNSTIYTGDSITVSQSGTIQVLAVASGYNNSSSRAAYTIIQPTPVLSGISPSYIPTYTASTLTVTGSNFIPGSTVYLNGVLLPTQYVSGTELTAEVAAFQVSDTASGSLAYSITVKTLGAPSVSNAVKIAAVSSNNSSLPITFTPSVATVTAGSSATFNMSVGNAATANVGIILGVPPGATDLFTPTPNSSTAGTFTISTSPTTPKGTYVITVVCGGTVPVTSAAILLPILLLPLLFLRRRMAAKGIWLSLCGGLILAAWSLSLAGCAATGPNGQFGSAGATTFVVNASTVTLTVQ